eukprot:1993439-Rhodomonas_salina.2
MQKNHQEVRALDQKMCCVAVTINGSIVGPHVQHVPLPELRRRREDSLLGSGVVLAGCIHLITMCTLDFRSSRNADWVRQATHLPVHASQQFQRTVELAM